MINKKTGKTIAWILLIALVLYIIYRYFGNKNTQVLQYRVPTSVDPSVFGPAYWRSFHSMAGEVPCPSCRGFAEKFMVFFHDMVNLKTGKPLYDVANFNEFTALICQIRDNNNTWPPTETIVE